MNTYFSDWYREANINPEHSWLEPRWKAVELAAQDASATSICELARLYHARRTKAPEEEYNHIKLARVCKKLIDAGGRVHLGAHGQLQGLGAHWELGMLEQGGFTPLEAIRAATIDGAKYTGLDKEIGSIEVGKFADMIVLEKNPLENIRNSEHIRYTIVNGKIYDARTMDRIGKEPKKRKQFYWEIDYRLKNKAK